MTQATEKTKPAAKAHAQSVELIEQPRGALATMNDEMFYADKGGGMENATQESFAIPFLTVLQPLSPQVDESDGKFVAGARAGMLYENITNRLIDGKTGALVVPVQYRRVYLRWGARGTDGAGFKGELTPEAVNDLRAERKIVELEGRLYFPLPDGTVNEKKCDRVVDTRNHYVLLIDETSGAAVQALLSLRSTQVRKSKQLMSALASVRFSGAHGPYQPPTFANLVRITTVPEKNESGSWHGVRCEIEGRVSSPAHYEAAKQFSESVKKGTVQVRYEEPADGDGRAAAPSSGADDDNRF